MVLSDFVFLETKQVRHEYGIQTISYAEVTVRTGHLFWKRFKRAKIYRVLGSSWRFLDTGQHTPGWQAENLASAWKAQTGQVI